MSRHATAVSTRYEGDSATLLAYAAHHRKTKDMNLRTLARIVVATIAVHLASSGMVAHARTLDAVKASRTWRVGLTGDYAPYARLAPDGTLHGADVTMARALGQSL